MLGLELLGYPKKCILLLWTGVQYSLLSLALPVAPELPAFSLSDLWSSHVILGSVMWLVAVWLEYDTAKRFAAFRKNADGKVG